MTQSLAINSERLQADFESLAQIGSTLGGGITRLALSNEDLEARAWFAERIEEAGLMVRDDEVGNLSGVLLSQAPDAKTFLMGSHLDTVPNGGKYDGAVGVLAALECLRTIKEAGLQLPVHLEAINFTDEEGAWQSFFGSMGLVGALDPMHITDAKHDNGAFRVALFRAGIRPNEIYRAQREPQDLAGFLELHIEQGERLEKAGKQIGIVERIVGRVSYVFTFYGEAAHAATTAVERQRDALQGAAAFITATHNMAHHEYPESVINCGSVQVHPGAFNVVPSEALLRIDLRHPNSDVLAEIESRLIRLAQEIARDYRLSVNTDVVLRRTVAHMDAHLSQTIEALCKVSQHSSMPIVSYAGHDAQILSSVVPSAMIFIPSQDGLSHNPREYTDWNCVVAGANLMLNTILKLFAND